METIFDIAMSDQPDDITCGPTCLYSVYSYYNDAVELEKVISTVRMLEEGGTFAAFLGIHALERGYDATIHSFNINIFDPTWWRLGLADLRAKLFEQTKAKTHKPKIALASKAYLEFLERGGHIEFEDLSPALLNQYLGKKVPIIVGLSATFLYKSSREMPDTNLPDDVRGEPQGHFVLLNGINASRKIVSISDPYTPNPISGTNSYDVDINHLICSILLGVVTYDANLLVIRPKGALA